MRLRPALAPATCALALVLAACGGGGGGDGDGVASLGDGDGEEAATDTTLSEEEAQEALLDWAECMREQGLDVPDPQFTEDGGVQIVVGREQSEGDDGEQAEPPDRDAFDAARETCGEPPQLPGQFTEEDRAEMQERSLAFAECMRDNGAEDFPDPDFSGDGPGAGPVTRERRRTPGEGAGEGAMIAGPFGEVDLSDPEVAAAFEVCGDELGELGIPPVAADERPAG